jgi:hypothetical protein
LSLEDGIYLSVFVGGVTSKVQPKVIINPTHRNSHIEIKVATDGKTFNPLITLGC